MNVITILGAGGGVARALLGILDRALVEENTPLYPAIGECQLHGIDRPQARDRLDAFLATRSDRLRERLTPHDGDAGDATALEAHLRATKTDVLVDLTGGDPREMLRACSRTGTRYLNSAIEITGPMPCEPVRILDEMETFRAFREEIGSSVTGIVGAGMNPGIVQWLALDLIRRNENRVPLACYVVEHDTTFFSDPARARPGVAYTTWSPEGFMYEAAHSRPIFMRGQAPVALFENVYARQYRVRLGDHEFFAQLMPHEEVLSLGRLFDMETAFLYRVNDHTTEVLTDYARREASGGPMPECRPLPQNFAELTGADKVGVLLVYPDREVFAWNRMETIQVNERFGTNATYYQVACGTAAALASLLFDSLPSGLYYVDELLLQTRSRFGDYVPSFLKDITYGANPSSDGMLFDRMRRNTVTNEFTES